VSDFVLSSVVRIVTNRRLFSPPALVIESASELITVDRDFARFPSLRWRPPFER
jgi:hypothetical protein